METKELTLRELLIGDAIRNCFKSVKRHHVICMTKITHLDNCWVTVNPLTKKGHAHVSITSGNPNEREPSIYDTNVFEKDIKTPVAWLKCVTHNTRLAEAINSIPEDKESGLEYAGYENPSIMIPVVTIKSNTWTKVVAKRLLANSIATYIVEIIEKYHLSDLPGELSNPIWITPTIKIVSCEDGGPNFNIIWDMGDNMLVRANVFTTNDCGRYITVFVISQKDRDVQRDIVMRMFERKFNNAVLGSREKAICNHVTTNVRRVKSSSSTANTTADNKIADRKIEVAMAAELRTRMQELTGVKMPTWMIQPALDTFDVVQVTGDISKGNATVKLTPSTKEYAPIFSSASLDI